jgi:hypothetical protein
MASPRRTATARSIAGRVVALAAACVVAGCALFEPQVVEVTPPPPAPKPPPNVATVAPPAQPPVPGRKPPTPEAPTTTANLPLLPPPPSPPAAERLLNLSQAETAALLGEPRQTAESPPATIWRYVGPTCELDLWFYLDLQSKVMRALHYEVKSNDPSERQDGTCIDQLVVERRGREGTAGSSYRYR